MVSKYSAIAALLSAAILLLASVTTAFPVTLHSRKPNRLGVLHNANDQDDDVVITQEFITNDTNNATIDNDNDDVISKRYPNPHQNSWGATAYSGLTNVWGYS